NVHNNPRASADERAAAARAAAEKERQRRIAAAKAKLLNAAKALAKIMMDELGITDALDCFLKGDMGGCLATAANVAGAAIGGALGKLAARYGAPWKWKKLANLTSRVKGLLGDLVDGVKSFMRAGAKCELHSFAAGTLVLLADGSKRPIEKLKPGDKVIATNPETGKTSPQEVVATHINLDLELTNLTLITADGSVLIETTAQHPFWSRDRATWVNASELRSGERMLTADGLSVMVAEVKSFVRQRVMYDLTVRTDHTYYVAAGGTSVLVHNCGGSKAGHSLACGCAEGAEPKLLPDFTKLPDRPDPDSFEAQTRHPQQPPDRSEWATDPREPNVPTSRWGRFRYKVGQVIRVAEKVSDLFP
ncbi:polymorphic toxin-type HINT domain-containing protein, partial [Micromonospora chokoriensis]